uniref:FAR1 domain-containing protein n=1 Tax=Schistocephalus solidus TaxID=70667 RepID=A0A0X3NPQ7_SCHSO
MDFTDSFQHSIAGKAFPTFDEFQKELEAFTEESGSQFILKKRLRHNLGHSMRDIHQYRYAHFVCAYAFSTDCEAFFTIASKSSCLRVVQFFMAHNHAVIYNPAFQQRDPNDEDGYEVRCDLSKEFESSFPVKHFSTYEEFEEQLKKFQTKTKSIYIKRNACRWPSDAPEKQHLVYRRLKIECVHYGQRKRNKPNKPNIKISCKLGCRSCFYITSSNGYITVINVNMKHNHPVPIEAALQYPQHTGRNSGEDNYSEYNVVFDGTTQFVEVFSSGRFPTFDDFASRLEEFQRVLCFSYSDLFFNLGDWMLLQPAINSCVAFGCLWERTSEVQVCNLRLCALWEYSQYQKVSKN